MIVALIASTASAATVLANDPTSHDDLTALFRVERAERIPNFEVFRGGVAPSAKTWRGMAVLLDLSRWTNADAGSSAPLSSFAFDPSENLANTWADWDQRRAMGYQAGLYPEESDMSVHLSVSFSDSWTRSSPEATARYSIFRLGHHIPSWKRSGIDAIPGLVASTVASALD